MLSPLGVTAAFLSWLPESFSYDVSFLLPPSTHKTKTFLFFSDLQIDEEQNPQNYCQTFHLIPRAGSYYVRNDIFRLVYG